MGSWSDLECRKRLQHDHWTKWLQLYLIHWVSLNAPFVLYPRLNLYMNVERKSTPMGNVTEYRKRFPNLPSFPEPLDLTVHLQVYRNVNH